MSGQYQIRTSPRSPRFEGAEPPVRRSGADIVASAFGFMGDPDSPLDRRDESVGAAVEEALERDAEFRESWHDLDAWQDQIAELIPELVRRLDPTAARQTLLQAFLADVRQIGRRLDDPEARRQLHNLLFYWAPIAYPDEPLVDYVLLPASA